MLGPGQPKLSRLHKRRPIGRLSVFYRLFDRLRGTGKITWRQGARRHTRGHPGINDEFIKNLGKTIPKSSSALFMLIKRSTPDKILPEIEPFRPRVIKISLSKEQEDKLRTALGAPAAHA